MHKLILPALIAIAAGLAAPVMAADSHASHSGHGNHGSAPAPVAALADGVVKKVDKAGGRVTVSHGPLPNGMPAMTMAFRVKEAGWLDSLKEGQKIRFAPEDVDGVLTIVRLEAAK